MVISRTPLRISFVGGGTDLPSFAREHGGAVVSTAIDKYVYVVVTQRFENDLRIAYSRTEIRERLDDVEHELIREALRMAGLPRGIEVVTIADVPSHGTGLGSSSALTVGALNALFAYQGILKSASELAAMAAEIEIEVLGKPIGRQDHYASAFGGLQLLRFGPRDQVSRRPVIVPDPVARSLERNLMMFYTGRQRSASELLGAVGATIERNGGAQEDLAHMRDLAIELFQQLGNGSSPDLVGEALHRNWELKRRLHPGIADSEIDRWYEAAREAGAMGGKLLGAGAGGFLLFYARPEDQPAVRRALRDLRELPFRFEREGSRISHVSQ
jgi:D-glycero-alpha-D-manno-heptose-7-phosphate kinase